MAVRGELKRKILEDSEPLKKRICLAQNVFISQRLQVERKEELVLECLCDFILSPPQCNDVKQAHETLLICLKSNRMRHLLSSDVQPAVRSLLIDTLKTSLTSESITKEVKLLAAKSIIYVFQDGCMERYLCRKTKKFIHLCSSLLLFLTTSSPSEETVILARQLINILMEYYRRCPEEQNFRSKFINSLMIPLIVLEDHLKRAHADIESDAIKCIHTITMTKEYEEIYKSILDYIFENTSHTKFVTEALLVQINSCEINYLPSCLPSVIRITFKAFVSKYRKSPDLVISMFAVLCALIGIRPPSTESCKSTINFERIQELLGENIMKLESIKQYELLALQAMLEVLVVGDFNLDDEYKTGGENGREWLARLITHVLTCITPNQAAAMMCVLSPLASVDLLLFESSLRNFLAWMCYNPYINLSQSPIPDSFSKLMIEALKASEKQQRTHKIIPNLLEGISIGIKKCKSPVDFRSLVSNNFLDSLEISCTVMHSKHYHSLINTMLFHLEEKCIKPMESKNCNYDVVPFTYILCKILNRVLCATKMAQHNTPSYLVEKFCDFMNTLSILLGRFIGAAQFRTTEDFEILENILELCWAWGEVRLLLLHYADPSDCAALALKSSASAHTFDVSLLHSYIKPNKWIEFGNLTTLPASCRKQLVAIVGQKLRACILLHQGDQEVNSTMAKVVASAALVGPLQPSLATLVPLLDKKSMKSLARTIAKDMVACGLWMNSLKSSIQCDSIFIGYITLALMKYIRDLNCGVSDSVLSPLKTKSFSPGCLSDVATRLSKISTQNETESLSSPLQLGLESLDILVKKLANRSIRTACAMTVLASCYKLGDNLDLPAKLIIQFLGPMGKDAPLPINTDYGHLICFMLSSQGIKALSYELQESLVMCLLGNCGVSPDSLIPGLETLTKALKKKPSSIASCIVNFLLPHIDDLVRKLSGTACKTDKFSVFQKDLSICVLKSSVKHQTNMFLPAFCVALPTIQDDDCELLHKSLVFLPSLIDNSTSPKLLRVLLHCILKLKSTFSKSVMTKIWPQLCSITHMPQEELLDLKKLIEIASEKQINEIIFSLVKQNLKSGFLVWHALIEVVKLHHPILRELQNCIRNNMHDWDANRECLVQSIIPTLKLLNTIAKTNVKMEYTFLDVCLDMINNMHLKSFTPEQGLIELLHASIDLLNTLVTSRATLVLERIPVLQQCLFSIIFAICSNAQLSITLDVANLLADCSSAVQRIGISFYKFKKDFSRAAPYMVSDVLDSLSVYNIHIIVKKPLEGYLQALLQLCDEHAEHFLLRSLSVASQQILRFHLDFVKKDKHMRV